MSEMTLNKYQELAARTALYPTDKVPGLVYVTFGLAGEAGEVAELTKKLIRDDDLVLTDERRAKFLKELGDVLWYVARLAGELGFTLEEVAQANVAKLTKRADEGTLKGDGSDR